MNTSRSNRALSGSLWIFSGLGAERTLSVAISIVLARILAPQDFAAVALTTAVVAVVRTLTEMGLSVAIIQKSDVTERMLDSAFALTTTFFAAGAALLVFLAGPLASYYDLTMLSPLVKLAAIATFFFGVTSFYRSMVLRSMNYRVISLVGVVATIVSGIVAVFCGSLGYGPFSILWGQIGAAVVTLTAFVVIKPFFPSSVGSIRLMKELLRFGAWVSIGRVLGTASGQFDRLLIGKLLPARTLGGYYLAHRMATSLPQLMTSAVDQILLPIYSSSKNDPQIIERGYWKGLRFSALLVLPLCLLIAVFARPMVWLLLGEKWLFITPLVQILSISGVIQSLGGGIFASVIYSSQPNA